jgi:peptidoglycan/LPS O-acetylase OafA/YrhL
MIYKGRIPSLDGLRGIAAIAVVSFHYNIFFLPQARLPFLGRAYLAVDLFFLLSGFVLAHVYGRELASNWRSHWQKFAMARFARIYPLFALTTIVMVTIHLSGTPLRLVLFSVRSLTLQPFLLQQWSGLSWNYPSWSISTEAEAYVFFVIFSGLLVTGKYPRLIGVCCVVILTALCITKGGNLNLYSGIPALFRTLAEFSFGVLLYRAHSNYEGFAAGWVGILTILFFGLATITKLDFFALGAFASLIYYSVNATDVFGRLLNSRPLLALGTWSYSIYLWHAPTQYAVMAVFAASGYPVNNLGVSSARLLVLATILVVVRLSAYSYQSFEAPARHFLMLSLPRTSSGVKECDRCASERRDVSVAARRTTPGEVRVEPRG